MLLGWRAWYTEGRAFDSASLAWPELPATGVLVVNAYHSTGRTVYSGADWYWFYNGRFGYVSSGEWGTWKRKPRRLCLSCVKRGEGVPDDEFRRVYAAAYAAVVPPAGGR